MHAHEGQPHPSRVYPADKSRELQRKLYRAAKKDRTRRFHALYDRMIRPDVLRRAWNEVKANGGSAGIDGQTIDEVERQGESAFLQKLESDLREGRYRPRPVRRVYIPKPDGRERPLGIPTIRDRVVQAACRLVIEPVFEANFLECSHGFRPKRSARQALRAVQQGLWAGEAVVDADIQGFFDNLDQEFLMSLVKRRVSDRRILKLLRGWMRAGVMEEGELKPTTVGTPQGGVISPLLANIYLHVMDMLWTRDHGKLGKLVRYADDFVILCQTGEQARTALAAMGGILAKLKLTLHPTKTRVVELDDEGFDFLGFRFHKDVSRRSGKRIPYALPSAKSMNRIRERVRELTHRRWLLLETKVVVRRLNPVIRGWCAYFRAANATRKLQEMDCYVNRRFHKFLWKRLGRQRQKEKFNDRFERWWPTSGVQRFYVPGVFGPAF